MFDPPLTGMEQATSDQVALCGLSLKVQEQEVGLVHSSARDYPLRRESDGRVISEESISRKRLGLAPGQK